MFNIRKALDFLNCGKEGENNKDSQKRYETVIVDIFARDRDGKIQLTNKNIIETHSILLVKDSLELLNNNILIIDPTNSKFSRHIEYNKCKLLLSYPDETDINFLVPDKEIQIYKPNGPVGPAIYI